MQAKRIVPVFVRNFDTYGDYKRINDARKQGKKPNPTLPKTRMPVSLPKVKCLETT